MVHPDIQWKRNNENNNILYRHTYNISIEIKNTVQNILKPYTQIDKYEEYGIYQMKCLNCPLKCIRQISQSFNIRYKEHI
jgi:hypothetical protein